LCCAVLFSCSLLAIGKHSRYHADMTKTPFMLIIFLLCACSLVQAQPDPTPTLIVTPSATAANPVEIATRDLQPIDQVTPTEDTTCTADANRLAARHTVWAEIDYTAHTVSVRQLIDYLNQDTRPLSEIVLDIETNYWRDALLISEITMFENTLPFTIEGEQLSVSLPIPLNSGCNIRFEMTYTLTVPALAQGVDAYKGYFSHTQRQFNLGHWLASVAVRQDGEWVAHDTYFIGEQSVLDVADWDVTLTVNNATDTLKVAAPGNMTQLEENVWHFVHNHARDFTVSMSEEFSVNSLETLNGVSVELYSLPDAQFAADDGHIIDAAAHALSSAQRAMSMYEDLYGAFPHSRVVIVQGTFPDGMEFDGLVFVSSDWFRTFTGDPAAYLTLITVHEIAHQWWYARVGNDAAYHPYLDEALSVYSEYVFIEEYYPQLRQWWWDFRVNAYSPTGHVDSTIYQFATIREYINAVYLRGAQMFHQLRQDLGTEAFFDWLRVYPDAENGQIATPRTLWSLLTVEQLEITQATREEYLSISNVEEMP
jgi:hypothetical protein